MRTAQTYPVHIIPRERILRTVPTARWEGRWRIGVRAFADGLIRERSDRLTARVEIGLRSGVVSIAATTLDVLTRWRIAWALLLLLIGLSARIARVIVASASTAIVSSVASSPSRRSGIVVLVVAVDIVVIRLISLRAPSVLLATTAQCVRDDCAVSTVLRARRRRRRAAAVSQSRARRQRDDEYAPS